MASQVIDDYAAVSAEYYDKRRHPTCAAFRLCSIALATTLLKDKDFFDNIVEIGAGRSSIPAIAKRAGFKYESLILVDSSPEMLAHSRGLPGPKPRYLVGNANDISLDDNSADLVFAGLGDPYNHHIFWKEARRICAPGGIVVFTTPAQIWAEQFRPHGQSSAQDAAEFERVDGMTIVVPSFILAIHAQIELIKEAGFQSVVHIDAHRRDLTNSGVPPKLAFLASEAPIVSAFYAT